MEEILYRIKVRYGARPNIRWVSSYRDVIVRQPSIHEAYLWWRFCVTRAKKEGGAVRCYRFLAPMLKWA